MIEGWDDDYVIPIEIADDNKQVMIHITGNEKTDPKFTFDRILWWDTTQEEAFTLIALPTCQDVVKGINGTIFAYGQTGSGKSYSVFGKEPTKDELIPPVHMMGIIPRAVSYVFEWINRKRDTLKPNSVVTELRVYEIYINNKLTDLLHPPKKGDKPLKIRDGRRGVIIQGLKSEKVSSVEDVLKYIDVAQANRTVSKTAMNQASSRSHCIVEFAISYKTNDGRDVSAKLNFGDLAGSEKIKKTQAVGQQLKEAQAINQSLTVLGQVIAALVKGQNPPFRDAALAHCLKNSLAGNCKTTLLVAASPHRFNAQETVNSFQFASRAKMIKTKASKNIDMSPKQMKKEIARLKAENKMMIAKLSSAGGGGGGSGPKIVTTWEGSDPPSDEKGRKMVMKECLKFVEDVMVNECEIHEDGLNYQVDIPKDPPFSATISFYPDEQYDIEECRGFRDRLYEKLKPKVNGPFSKHTSMVKEDPVSPELVEELKKRISELEVENKEMRDENIRLKKDELELQKQLEAAQAQLAAVESQAAKDRVGGFLTGMARGFKKGQQDGGLAPTGAPTLSVNNSTGFSLADVEAGPDLSIGGGSGGMGVKPEKNMSMRYTGDTTMSKAALEMIEAKRAADAQHAKIVKELQDVIVKQNEMINQQKVIGARGAADQTNAMKMLDMIDGQSTTLVNSFEQLDRYWQEIDSLKGQLKARDQSIQVYEANASKKDETVLDLRKQISDLNNELDKYNTLNRQSVMHQVDSFKEQQRRASRLLTGGDVVNLATGARVAGKRTSVILEKKPASPADSIQIGGMDSTSLWGLVKKKTINNAMQRKSNQAANAVSRMATIVDEIANKKAFLSNNMDKYFDSRESRMRGSDNFDAGDFDGKRSSKPGHRAQMTFYQSGFDIMQKDVPNWTVEEVCQWLKTACDGELAKYIATFRKNSVDGEALLALDSQALQMEYRMKKQDVKLLKDAIAEVYDYDVDDDSNNNFDIPEDIAAAFLEKELKLLQNVRLAPRMPVEVLTFSNFRATFPDLDKALSVKVFSLLEKDDTSVILVDDLRRFLKAAETEPGADPDDDSLLFEDMLENLAEFVEYKDVFKKSAPNGKLNIHGAKKILKRLRECSEDDIRDADDGVTYLVGLSRKEFLELIQRCPQAAWKNLSNFNRMELLFRNLEKNAGPGRRIAFDRFHKALTETGVEVQQHVLRNCLEDLNFDLERSSGLDYERVVGKLAVVGRSADASRELKELVDQLLTKCHWEPPQEEREQSIDSDEEEEMKMANMEAMRSIHTQRQADLAFGFTPRAATSTRAGGGRASMMQGRASRSFQQGVPMPASANRMPSGQAAASLMPPRQMAMLDNARLNSVRTRLALFAAFASANRRGFADYNDSSFHPSSIRDRDNTDAGQVCRLHQRSARGPSGWCADPRRPNADATHHIVVDNGQPRDLYAVAMQGRADKDEWVTQATILVSDDPDGVVWKSLPQIHTFSCFDRNSVVVYPLYSPVRCRFVKLRLEKWQKNPSLRWDCLFV